ncbi:hypothetical protein BDW42DRAFT_122437 [Aspergillus taichungensis]|uniref:Uncharacterized protein n=1 Tax=Aspergillus taichungensis TaxID=482145 RepID=A0A2J5HR95_9EURO|nr:hypothetical protein BDW42DRAFT_122437 [Aspergillus taichungensis]
MDPPLGLHGRFSTTNRIKKESSHGTDTIGAISAVKTGLQGRSPQTRPSKRTLRPRPRASPLGWSSRQDAGMVLGSARRNGRAEPCFFLADIIFHCLRNFVVMFLFLLIIARS